MSSTAMIKSRDNGSSTAAGAIMPCVGGLIFWVDFPSKQCKGGNDWPGAVCGHTADSAGLSHVEVSTRMKATSSKRDHSAATVGFDIGQGSRYDEFIRKC